MSTFLVDDPSLSSDELYETLRRELALPFSTRVMELDVLVTELERDEVGHIYALCSRATSRMRIPLADLPLPQPPPRGAHWIKVWARSLE